MPSIFTVTGIGSGSWATVTAMFCRPLKLEERQPEQAPNLEEARQQIELALLQERSQRKYRESVAELKGRIKVEIIEPALDFPYVRKNPA